jgi:hypothetical protein
MALRAAVLTQPIGTIAPEIIKLAHQFEAVLAHNRALAGRIPVKR